MRKTLLAFIVFLMIFNIHINVFSEETPETTAFLSLINNATTANGIIPILATVDRSIFHIPNEYWVAYDSFLSSKKTQVAQGLISRGFTSVSQFENTFVNNIEVVQHSSSTGGPSSGGSGGGGSSGSATFSVRTDISYMLEKVEFVDSQTIEATITFVSDYADISDFYTFSIISVYDKATSRFICLSTENIILTGQPFFELGRRSIKQRVTLPTNNVQTYKIKAIMLTSFSRIQPTCSVPNRFNEYILKNY